MVRKFLVFWIAIMPAIVRAQVTVNVQLPPAGMISKDQLWNLVLANGTNNTLEVNILLNLQDAVTGQSILSGGTRSVFLGKGVKVLNIQDVQPVQYNYGSGGMNNNYLPLGSYIACYTINQNSSKGAETIANECVRLNIAPLSPPLLNTPADKSVLQTQAPQLTWIPPAPLNMFDNLNYELNVAEVMQGQSPLDAVRYNIPVYTKNNGRVPYENYPSTYSKLETGKTYAWQVVAKSGFNYAAATEVWTFTIAKDSAKVEMKSSSYILLKNNRNEAGVNYIDGTTLLVKYYSYDKEHEQQVRFSNAQGKLVQQVKQKIIYGDNFLQFKLNNAFESGQLYFIEIRDEQNQIHTASFSIK
jgi:hypothetical protein